MYRRIANIKELARKKSIFLFGTRPTGKTTLLRHEYGKAFEHFIAMELRSYLSYRRIKKGLSYWRTHNGTEVDFLIGRTSAVEVKATAKIQEKHLKGLRMLREEGIVQKFHVVCLDETDRQTSDGIRVLHWRSFLDQLWNDELEI
jgi:predicted AAA+ superfamily ATPase